MTTANDILAQLDDSAPEIDVVAMPDMEMEADPTEAKSNGKWEHRDAYQTVTDRILAIMESTGKLAWEKGWANPGHAARNMVSGHVYSGVNAWVLMLAGYESPYWMTVNQARKFGAWVRKGEKGMPLVRWMAVNKKKKATENGVEVEKTEKILIAKKLPHVFNVAQFENLPADAIPAIEAQGATKVQSADEVIANMQNAPKIVTGNHNPAYAVGLDTVYMPADAFFHSTDEKYMALFHEVIHSTGHKSRLDRNSLGGIAPFGSPTYSFEELVAELGAAMICARLGIAYSEKNSAAYVQGWSKQLKADSKLIVKAATKAMQAVAYVFGELPRTGEAADAEALRAA